jgi:hypothetical protein
MQLGRVKAMLDHMEDRSDQGPWSHHLFGMRNIPFIKDVLATMGVAVNVEAMCAHGIPLVQLKVFKFNASELLSAGFDLAILAAAGFTAEELISAGLTADELIAAGFTEERLAAAAAAAATAVAAFQKQQAAAKAKAALAAAFGSAMGGLSGSALLQRVGDGNKVQQFAALLRGKLPGRSYRLLYTWSRDGRSAASFHQRCDNQVCSRTFVRSAAARVTAGAGAHARHRALHHGPHVRRLRERAVAQLIQLHRRCGMLPVPGRKSSRRRPHLL